MRDRRLPPCYLRRSALLLALSAGLFVAASFSGSGSNTALSVSVHSRIGTQPCELVQRGTLQLEKEYAWVQIEGQSSETYSPEMGSGDYLVVPASASGKVTKEARKSGFELKLDPQAPVDLPVVRNLQANATCPNIQGAIAEVDQARKQRQKEIQGKLYKAGAAGITPPVALKEQPPKPDQGSAPSPASSGAASSPKKKPEGTASLIALIDIDGSVKQTKIVRSSSLDVGKRASEEVARWKFSPARKNGLPVPSYIPVEINFHLQ